MLQKTYIPPDADILPPTDDCIFKSLLTRDEPESRIVLMDIISSIIGYKVVEVAVLNNEIATTDITQLQERLDVNCRIDNGDYVNIEMQAARMEGELSASTEALINRVSYYACDLYSSQGIKGKSYIKLNKAYQITLMDFTLFEGKEQFVNRFQFRNEAGEMLTDDVNIVLIELSKLRKLLCKPVEEMTPLEMWLIFFKYIGDKENRGIVNRILEVKEEIGMAGTLLQSISKDDYERAHFLSRRKFLNDMESAMNEYMEKGLKEGMEKGMEEGMEEGLKEGMEKGIIKDRTEAILELLEDYGCVSEDLRKKITGETDIATLKKWFRHAARAGSIAEFEKQM